MTDPRLDLIRSHTRPFAVPGLEPIRLYQADELTPLWTATESDLADRQLAPPFWAFAWAGGQGLARFLLEHPATVAGKRVLDLASGSGLVAIAAVLAGAAQVTANDIDPTCEAAIALNAELNDVRIDFTGGDLLGGASPESDVVLAGDVFYEQQMAQRFHAFLLDCRRAGAAVFAGDPGRAYVPAGLELAAEYAVPTSLEIENAAVKTARVLRY
ncbi:MAG: methyltransferase [Alphaproteobacteria bacterium]|nr:methyltransferase [Alphaproteobacteria bacterium]